MKKRRRTANTTKKRDAIDLSAKVGLMHKTCERTHAKMGAQVHYSTKQHHLLASQEPGITEIKHPGTADTAHRRAQASLQGRNRQKCIHKARACAQPNTAAPCTHPAKPHHQPGIMQKPGIPAQQMERTGTRASGCRSGTGQNPLLEHAHTAPQPRSIAWEGGGEAAMKGGAPWSARVAGHVPLSWSSDVVIFYW